MGLNATLGLAAGLLIAGSAFGLGSLHVPGIALLILATGAGGWVLLATRGARVERSAGPATVIEGEPYPLRIELRGGLLPLRGELVDPVLARPVPISVSGRGGVRVGPRARVTVAEEGRFGHRGRQRLDSARLIVADPLGLCFRQVEGCAGPEVLVLPRIEPVLLANASRNAGGDATAGAGEGAGAGLASAAGAEIDGLRPYRKGSPASRIHWRAVARHGDLIERRLASGDGGTTLVVLDAERPADRDALDRAVRAAASLCVHLARAGGCTLVAPGSPRPLRIDPRLRGWAQAHARLALAEPGMSMGSRLHALGGGIVFWVTARAEEPPPSRLPRGSFIVTPLPDASDRAAFTVAGCHGLPLAAAQLARGGIRRAA